MARRVVDVLVPVALDQAYSYRVPEHMELAPGDVVSVPLGVYRLAMLGYAAFLLAMLAGVAISWRKATGAYRARTASHI